MSRPKEKRAYSPRWQDYPGYKTLVDMKSEKGILPSQTEDGDLSKGQGKLDAIWPVPLSQTREKERALPLPSDFDKKRDKKIGPTYYNKPRKSPDRTLSEPGAEYGHPTKYDYNYPRRRQDVTGGEDEVVTGPDDLEAAIDQLLEMSAVYNPFEKRQKNQGGEAKLYSHQYYLQHPSIAQKERLEWRTEKKHNRAEKRQRSFRERNPAPYKRKGIGYRDPAQRTKDWRERQRMQPEAINERRDEQQEKEKKERAKRNKRAGWEALAQAMELLGLDLSAANWPVDWNTHTKKTNPPGQLDQNYGKGQSKDEGSPRKDPESQKGESLRAPDLTNKPQPGLKWEIEPAAPGGLDYPLHNVNNPTDGSGKVIPMSYYTDITQNTQAIPDGRQDRYLHNDNFEVKQARFGRGVRGAFGVKIALTLAEILEHVDDKIKERAKDRPPTLVRTDTKNWIWHWRSGSHTVRVQAFKRGKSEKFPKLNLRISCTCPFWRWWGPEHWATQEGYQRGPLQGTASYPEVRDPEHWRPVCKHAYAVLQKSVNFFVRPKKAPLKKLGSRFFVDSIDEIEIEPVAFPTTARVAHAHLERTIRDRVVARYLARKDT